MSSLQDSITYKGKRVVFKNMALYALGDKCGGNFRYTDTGLKDCTNCQLPHKRRNYGYVTGKYQELAEMMKAVKNNQTEK